MKNIFRKLLGLSSAVEKDATISTPPLICPKCKEENNPNCNNCWKCKTILKNVSSSTSPEMVEKIKEAIVKGKYDTEQKKKLDDILWGRVDELHATVKEIHAAYKEEEKIFQEKGRCDYPKQTVLLDKFDSNLSYLKEQLKEFTPPLIARNQYEQIALMINDYFVYSKNHRALLCTLWNTPAEQISDENASAFEKMVQQTMDVALKSLNSANARWGIVKKYFLEEFQATIEATLILSKQRMEEALRHVHISEEIQAPYIKYARKIVGLADDVTKFTVETLALDKNNDSLVTKLDLNISMLFAYLAEKMGERMGIPEKPRKLLCPAICVMLIERSPAFDYNSLDKMLETTKVFFSKYDKEPHLLPEDNKENPLDTVFGNALIAAVHSTKFDLELDAAKDKKYGKVINYCHDKILEMGDGHNVFSDEIKKL